MNILIGTDTFYPHVNGISYFVQHFAEQFSKRGNQVTVIAPSRNFFSETYSSHGYTVWGARSFPALFYSHFRIALPFLLKRYMRSLLKEINPDIIHVETHFFIARLLIELASELHIPIIARNGMTPINITNHIPFKRITQSFAEKIIWRELIQVFSKADFVSTPTQTAANQMYAVGFKKHITPISYGIDLSCFRKKGSMGQNFLKEKFKFPEKSVLLFVGRLDPEKNIDVVIRAFPRILNFVDIQFVVVGPGGEKAKLEKLAEDLGVRKSIIFTGFIPNEDLPAVYRAADCFIMPGTAETQSIATMEAMASGLPVVAVRAGALPELVGNGENGFLFDLDNREELVSAISALFRDSVLRQEMGEKSYEKIQSHNIVFVIHTFEEVYKKVITDYHGK